jgi:predicted enzyme related to lactoylglutathione lyase
VTGPVRAVMLFVDEPEHAARWWAAQLGHGATAVDHDGLWTYERDGVEVAFHLADEAANPHGASTVVYWAVADVEHERDRLLRAGCRAHRGPLRIGPQRQICQLIDPFGNVLGLDGR